MTKDLTNSTLERQNILNNPFALQEIEKATRIKGIHFEGKTVVLKEQVAAFFEVTLRTIENYLGKYSYELAQNGYEILKGNRLKKLKLTISESDVPETDFGNITMGTRGRSGLYAYHPSCTVEMHIIMTVPLSPIESLTIAVILFAYLGFRYFS
jgi:hypothetical protein